MQKRTDERFFPFQKNYENAKAYDKLFFLFRKIMKLQKCTDDFFSFSEKL